MDAEGRGADRRAAYWELKSKLKVSAGLVSSEAFLQLTYGCLLPVASHDHLQVVTFFSCPSVWTVPHALQNSNGSCVHFPVFLLSESPAQPPLFQCWP
uniref:protein yippee-like 1 isoform X6 n=1 Tax=Jaculus jaculus TaxID=51337 RepID=UPI001E1B249B|nr:protein yippee-like 1 isoform X6 [Jaculus jaculus]